MQTGWVVEDLKAPAQWLQEILAEAFPDLRVHHADSLANARTLLRQHPPDIALIDLGLPDGSGVELIRDLAPRGCQCVVTTIYADDHHLFPALRAGACGYLLKDQPGDKVVHALRGIVAGEPPLSPVIAQRLLRVFGAPANPAERIDARLSNREHETLTLIAKGFRLPEVAAQLGVSRNTAAGFIKAIYRKLDISSRAEATLEATRMGLVDPRMQ
ncbi:response regulator [Sinimarinibacterium flocculans]|uniref:LuxR family two component transcriptional regulator n=1 Tax=Sinimarinibacterium flocculans TaxID=985250 RepID=A0A318E8T1_9GAMM|nr:response regulator transcription factor [Sinimarinibacterium flocculans]PXV68427.1 LuxR family two component transcriptional regulator [Sinimarinibacterium flocculans]